jgi:phage tail-like protein
MNTGTFGKEPYYPMVGFYFTVSFDQISNDVDSKFKEVSGLEIKLETKPIKSGGDDGSKIHLPERATFSDLVLSRGLLSANSQLSQWCYSWLLNDYSQPKRIRDVFLKLLNEESNPIMVWQFVGAYPVGIKIKGFDAMASGTAALLVETITLRYSSIQIINT